jgi:hypothetical protein
MCAACTGVTVVTAAVICHFQGTVEQSTSAVSFRTPSINATVFDEAKMKIISSADRSHSSSLDQPPPSLVRNCDFDTAAVPSTATTRSSYASVPLVSASAAVTSSCCFDSYSQVPISSRAASPRTTTGCCCYRGCSSRHHSCITPVAAVPADAGCVQLSSQDSYNSSRRTACLGQPTCSSSRQSSAFRHHQKQQQQHQ